MKRPWHIWTTFLICLLVAVGGMSWLTVKAVELDRAEIAARRQQQLLTLQADFEGNVRLALRRMDQFLAELFSEESDWPEFAYQSFYQPSGQPPRLSSKNGAAETGHLLASPLLNPQTTWNKIYFQSGPKNTIASPNLPPEPLRELAIANGWCAPAAPQYEQRLTACEALLAQYNLPEMLRAARSDAADVPNPPTAPGSGEAISDAAPDVSTSDQFAQVTTSLPENLGPQLDVQQPSNQKQKFVQQRVLPSEQIDRGNDAYQRRRQDIASYQSKSKRRLQKRDALYATPAAPTSTPQPLRGDQTSQPIATTELTADTRSRPLWLGDELILARQVEVKGAFYVQGCWLDWPAIQKELAARVVDLLPVIRIDPVQSDASGDLSRMLATLPAQLVVTPPALADVPSDGTISPMQLSLWIAWSCFFLAALAFATLLAGVVALSERRATFVSAVTHELRTPLTTFRMYAEMLAEGMVPDADRRQQYLDTLKTEADRLFHLIENVLSYAQLERGSSRRSEATQTLGALLDALQPRLEERTLRDGMTLVAQVEDAARDWSVSTDVAAVEQIVANLIDNACKYAATATDRRIHLDITADQGSMSIRVRDHGPGIAPSERAALFRPFTKSADQAAHSAPGVGLGLALCRRLARQLGGRLTFEPTDGSGACFVLRVPSGYGANVTTM